MAEPTTAQRHLARAILTNLRKAPGYRGRLHTELETMSMEALRSLLNATQFMDAEIDRLENRVKITRFLP